MLRMMIVPDVACVASWACALVGFAGVSCSAGLEKPQSPVKDKTWPRDKTWPPVLKPADPDLPRNKTMCTLNRMSGLMYCPEFSFDTRVFALHTKAKQTLEPWTERTPRKTSLNVFHSPPHGGFGKFRLRAFIFKAVPTKKNLRRPRGN